MNISIYGIGNFGYAFLKHLDDKNTDEQYKLTAYDYKPERVEYLNQHRSHPVLHPETSLSDDIVFTNDIGEMIADADIVLLAVPSPTTREALQNIRQHATRPVTIVNTAKSLDIATGQRLSEVAAEELAGVDAKYALIAGGTIASDLFASEPLGVDIACTDQATLDLLQPVFESDNLHVYTTTDTIGVEYAAACKNIISILAGIVSGLGFSYGAETHAISRLASEIGNVCVSNLGAQASTFSIGSQCWGNDMWMSCTGNTRNRQFGELIGRGITPDTALQKMADENKLVEGYNTLKTIGKIDNLRSIETLSILHDIIVDKHSTVETLRSHLLRSA